MHLRLQSLKLITATLLLSLVSPLTLAGTKLEIPEAAANAQSVNFDKASEGVESLTSEEKLLQRTIELRNLSLLQDNLRRQEQSAVMLYPMILEDRLELVLLSANALPVRRTVPVKQEELNQAIAQFKSALQNPSSNAKVPAQTLYNWLIKPIEDDLAQAQAKSIIYAPDGQLRYIPLAALHDGKQWLIERFAVNNVTAVSFKDFNPSNQKRELRVLAAAFSEEIQNVKIGDREMNFSALPFAQQEVENLATLIPDTTVLLGHKFTREALLKSIPDHNIIHLATNGAFVIDKPQDSFILLGNGDRITLGDVETWNLKNVDLVVLSACETGLGSQLGNGEEILGFGYTMQEAGARAVIASLWSIDDGGTQVLMDAFYTKLANGNITKAEALRQAQIALIASDDTASSQEKGGLAVVRRQVKNRFSHPFYWAPFILIGNGL